MKVLTFFLFVFTIGILEAQNFWEKTVFPTDNSSLYSVYSMITNSDDNILAGTYSKGVFKSDDEGLTWVESGLTNQWVVSFTKNSTGNIYAASIGSNLGSGIYKSADGGNTWTRVWEALTGMNCVYTDQYDNVYVGLNYTSDQSGIYRSTNSGETWQKIFDNTENIYAITRLSGGRILAAGYGKIFYSDNEGGSWSESIEGLVSFTPSALVVNPLGEVFLSTQGYGIYKSIDNGISWVNKTGAGPEYSCLLLNTDGSMYTGTKGYWVYRSLNNGENWDIINSGMDQDKYVLSLLTTKSGYIFAGMDYYGLYRSVDKAITEVENVNLKPSRFSLEQNYPNPFNPSTTIKYSIPLNERSKTLNVQLVVYDILGREVATLVNQKQKPGSYEVEWNANKFPNGVYFYKINIAEYSEVRKMILLK
jgi:photosystem II stability/assembly factor-like uncharacterized protein